MIEFFGMYMLMLCCETFLKKDTLQANPGGAVTQKQMPAMRSVSLVWEVKPLEEGLCM